MEKTDYACGFCKAAGPELKSYHQHIPVVGATRVVTCGSCKAVLAIIPKLPDESEMARIVRDNAS